jgi:HEAT repeat protein
MAEPEPEKPGSLKERNTPAVLLDPKKEEIRKHIKDLLSDDYTVRAASISELEKFGEDAAEELVDTIIRKSDQPHMLANFSDALAEIGRPSVNVVLHALTHIVEIRKPEDVYLLESFVELLGRLQERRAAAPLLEQLGKLDAAIKRNHHKQLVHCCEAAKVRIHHVLVELGEKGGLQDLLEMLGEGRHRVRDGVVAALTRIGDKRAVVPLVRLYDIEEHVSFSGAQFIKEAIREIARREHLTHDDPLYKELTTAERVLLDRILPKPKAGNGRH